MAIKYIIHKQRGGKPMIVSRKVFDVSAGSFHKDGWREATMAEIKKFYEVEEIKPKKKPTKPKKEEKED